MLLKAYLDLRERENHLWSKPDIDRMIDEEIKDIEETLAGRSPVIIKHLRHRNPKH
jgi:hypothetical protein